MYVYVFRLREWVIYISCILKNTSGIKPGHNFQESIAYRFLQVEDGEIKSEDAPAIDAYESTRFIVLGNCLLPRIAAV